MSQNKDFHWPNQRQEPLQHSEQLPQGVATTVKNIITTLIAQTGSNTETTVNPQQNIITEKATIVPSVVDNTFSNQTVQTATENILTTVTDSISTTVRNIITTGSSGNGFILTENTNSNNTVFTSNDNSTVLTEILGSNTTLEETGSTIGSTFETISTEPNSITETITTIINSTDDMFDVSTTITDTMLYNQTSSHQSNDHTYHDESVTVYVILGVLLAILIIIFITLLVFYRKYKKCRLTSGDYCVTQLKEISSSSSIKTSSDLSSINVKH